MKQRSKAGGKAGKTGRRKATKLMGRRSQPKAVPGRCSAATGQETEIARLTRERDQAVQQQRATADVLKIISRSTLDLQPVFDSMAESAVRLCEAERAYIFRFDGKVLRAVASFNAGPENQDWVYRNPIPLGRHSVSARAGLEQTTVQVADVQTDPEYHYVARDVDLIRTTLAVPMLKGDELIGTITLYRLEVKPFTENQVALMETFADQAVIAIENARLFEAEQQRSRELAESLEQQTATSEVLKVISRSAFDLQPVFDAIAENGVRLCEAERAFVFRFDGEFLRAVAHYNVGREIREFVERNPIAPGRHSISARAALEQRTIHVSDVQADPDYAYAMRDVDPIRTMLAVPMLKGSDLVGTITIYRLEIKPFTEKQVTLIETFAAQAVIAIENTRLLNELRESLQQQTATSEILEVISNSPTDSQPAFEAIVHSALNLFPDAVVVISLPDGDLVELAAIAGADVDDREALRARYPMPLSREYITGTAILDAREMDFADARDTPAQLIPGGRNFLASGYRALTVVPMLRGDAAIGAITVTRRLPGSLSDKQRELLRTFASQAVIAIENTRLFNELRELLARQTATSEVLQVTTFDLERVFNTLLETAMRLCEFNIAAIWRRDGDCLRLAACLGVSAEFEKFARETPLKLDRASFAGRAAVEGKTVHISDVLADPEITATGYQEHGNYRTGLGVPLLREGEAIGVFALARSEVKPYADTQIELVQNFAAQAVVAVENVRLLNELRELLQQQTATADVLKVISRSAFDLLTVLDELLKSAAGLCDADQGTITQRKGDRFYRTVSYGFPPGFVDFVKDVPVEPGRETGTGRALADGKIIHIPDVLADPDYTWTAAQQLGGFRTLLGVPMLRDGVSVGVLTLTRTEVRPFTDKQIELVSTFADQAAIAIENVRLFEAELQRTKELAKSLEDLRTAQDRLVQTQKLASLGQLTAGIAHEIKNPLNFVNNFSGVSVELIDELQETLGRVTADDKTRGEITELADTLRDNLNKIVQHGKRADSIVKNMLLHSREGTGERRSVDVNALIEESLNLAYHGARAEKQGFNVALERCFDPGPARSTPFLRRSRGLNLIANAFYAATTRQGRGGGEGFEPTITAATKGLGDRVEIRIRDNGTGIPPEVRERMFNPFFTTKPAGEGTGLGLSISHDIIVKQHSGSIEVDTEPGEFTEFRIILPRTAA